MSDIAAALHIRDRAVTAIRSHGRPAETLLAQGVPVLAMRAGGCVVSLWGPFRLSPSSPWPEPATAALPGPLLHRLVVWNYGRQLVLDWGEDACSATIHGFIRGSWEAELLEALEVAVPSQSSNEVSS